MINPKSGRLKFEDGFALGPRSDERKFNSPFSNAWDDKEGNHWRIMEFNGHQWNGNDFTVSAVFKNGSAQKIEVMLISGKLGEDWSEFKKESEMKRKKAHDTILDDALGVKRDFNWGHVCSNYDPRSGFATLEVIYGKRSAPKAEALG